MRCMTLTGSWDYSLPTHANILASPHTSRRFYLPRQKFPRHFYIIDGPTPEKVESTIMPLSVEDNFKLLASYCLFNGDADKVAKYMGITKNAVYVSDLSPLRKSTKYF